MKDSAAYNRLSIEYCKDMIAIRKLAFERHMERFEIDEANTACAGIEYWERELKRRQEREANHCTANPTPPCKIP